MYYVLAIYRKGGIQKDITTDLLEWQGDEQSLKDSVGADIKKLLEYADTHEGGLKSMVYQKDGYKKKVRLNSILGIDILVPSFSRTIHENNPVEQKKTTPYFDPEEVTI